MNKRFKISLALIILLSAFLRFYNLSGSAMFAYDEGLYFNVVKTARASFDYLSDRLQGEMKDIPFSQYIQKKGGTHYAVAKPTYLLILFLASLLIGLKDYTLPLTSSIFGVSTVILIF
jgi:4-amino-4-deoxy-L-arabinose transferase-like glycosyltransferase